MIIGAGPAGLTASIYAVRYGLTTIVFEKMFVGGQVTTTPEIENYPGTERITGFDLAMNLHSQATKLGVSIVNETVQSLVLDGTVKQVQTNTNTYQGKTIILANGAERRKIGCPGEEEFAGRGVSYCASCDGAFFREKNVAIVGGGNTALEDALFLSNLCRKVYLIHRRSEFRGMHFLQAAVSKQSNIHPLMNCNIEAIHGEKTVNSIVISNAEGETDTIMVDAVFVAIGNVPSNQIVKNILELDASGYIVADESCKTKMNGVFVAGDTRTKELRQIVTATGDGAVAAFRAANYINQGM